MKQVRNSKSLKKIKPVTAFAVISKDCPPSIWAVFYYRENNPRPDLDYIKVRITPVLPKKKKDS